MTEERAYRGLLAAEEEVKEVVLLCWDDGELFQICSEAFEALKDAQEKVRLLWELRNERKFDKAEKDFVEEK
jgi:hypothetical protein